MCIRDSVKSVLDGITASTYTEGGSEYDINVVYPEDYLDNYIQLNSLQIKSAAGQWVTLGDIAVSYTHLYGFENSV